MEDEQGSDLELDLDPNLVPDFLTSLLAPGEESAPPEAAAARHPSRAPSPSCKEHKRSREHKHRRRQAREEGSEEEGRGEGRDGRREARREHSREGEEGGSLSPRLLREHKEPSREEREPRRAASSRPGPDRSEREVSRQRGDRSQSRQSRERVGREASLSPRRLATQERVKRGELAQAERRKLSEERVQRRTEDRSAVKDRVQAPLSRLSSKEAKRGEKRARAQPGVEEEEVAAPLKARRVKGARKPEPNRDFVEPEERWTADEAEEEGVPEFEVEGGKEQEGKPEGEPAPTVPATSHSQPSPAPPQATTVNRKGLFLLEEEARREMQRLADSYAQAELGDAEEKPPSPGPHQLQVANAFCSLPGAEAIPGTATERMHREIELFGAAMAPLPWERDLRRAATGLVLRACALSGFPHAAIVGSAATGTEQWSLEVEVVLDPSSPEPPAELVALERQPPRTGLASEASRKALGRVSAAIKQLSGSKDQPTCFSRFFCNRFHDSLKCDFGHQQFVRIQHHPVGNLQWMHDQLQAYPMAKRLLPLLTALVTHHKLRKTHAGGLSVFSLELMLIAFFQLHEEVYARLDHPLAHALDGFLVLYGAEPEGDGGGDLAAQDPFTNKDHGLRGAEAAKFRETFRSVRETLTASMTWWGASSQPAWKFLVLGHAGPARVTNYLQFVERAAEGLRRGGPRALGSPSGAAKLLPQRGGGRGLRGAASPVSHPASPFPARGRGSAASPMQFRGRRERPARRAEAEEKGWGRERPPQRDRPKRQSRREEEDAEKRGPAIPEELLSTLPEGLPSPQELLELYYMLQRAKKEKEAAGARVKEEQPSPRESKREPSKRESSKRPASSAALRRIAEPRTSSAGGRSGREEEDRRRSSRGSEREEAEREWKSKSASRPLYAERKAQRGRAESADREKGRKPAREKEGKEGGRQREREGAAEPRAREPESEEGETEEEGELREAKEPAAVVKVEAESPEGEVPPPAAPPSTLPAVRATEREGSPSKQAARALEEQPYPQPQACASPLSGETPVDSASLVQEPEGESGEGVGKGEGGRGSRPGPGGPDSEVSAQSELGSQGVEGVLHSPAELQQGGVLLGEGVLPAAGGVLKISSRDLGCGLVPSPRALSEERRCTGAAKGSVFSRLRGSPAPVADPPVVGASGGAVGETSRGASPELSMPPADILSPQQREPSSGPFGEEEEVGLEDLQVGGAEVSDHEVEGEPVKRRQLGKKDRRASLEGAQRGRGGRKVRAVPVGSPQDHGEGNPGEERRRKRKKGRSQAASDPPFPTQPVGSFMQEPSMFPQHFQGPFMQSQGSFLQNQTPVVQSQGSLYQNQLAMQNAFRQQNALRQGMSLGLVPGMYMQPQVMPMQYGSLCGAPAHSFGAQGPGGWPNGFPGQGNNPYGGGRS